MTSREAFEAHWATKTVHIPGPDGSAWTTWQAAIEWASQQAIEAVDKVIQEEAPEYQFCQEAIREALS